MPKVHRDGISKKYPKEYSVWQGMNRRCHNKNDKFYAHYGGRGIKICDRWLGPDGFKHFIDDMGPRPKGVYPSGIAKYSIDRIDVNGNYCPENCRWATSSEQSMNKRTRDDSPITVFHGKEIAIKDLARKYGLNYDLVYRRYLVGNTEDSLIRESHRGAKFRVLCIETGMIFCSAAEAARMIHVSEQGITACLRGKNKTSGGFHWGKIPYCL